MLYKILPSNLAKQNNFIDYIDKIMFVRIVNVNIIFGRSIFKLENNISQAKVANVHACHHIFGSLVSTIARF